VCGGPGRAGAWEPSRRHTSEDWATFAGGSIPVVVGSRSKGNQHHHGPAILCSEWSGGSQGPRNPPPLRRSHFIGWGDNQEDRNVSIASEHRQKVTSAQLLSLVALPTWGSMGMQAQSLLVVPELTTTIRRSCRRKCAIQRSRRFPLKIFLAE